MTGFTKQYPPIVIVDENDDVIGSASLAEAWQKGLYHRIVSVFIEDDHGRMLLQRRSPHVKIYPNCWDQAAGGHVDAGHSYEETAYKELFEEIGLRDLSLKELGTFRANDQLDDDRINNQFERVYLARIAHDTVLEPNPEEVIELRWFTPGELAEQITSNPNDFTPGFMHALQAYFPKFDIQS